MQGADPTSTAATCSRRSTAGDFPEWELGVQLFTEEEAAELPVRPPRPDQAHPRGTGAAADGRPHGARPLARTTSSPRPSRSPSAPPTSSPASTSRNDPLLQGRLFSYLDTQLIAPRAAQLPPDPDQRAQVPVRQPCSATATCRCSVPKGRANYEPSSLERRPTGRETPATGFRSFAEPIDDGAKGRIRAESFADHYSQARLFFRSQTADRAGAHRLGARVRAVQGGDACTCARRMVGHLRNVDERPRPARRRRPGAWTRCRRAPKPAAPRRSTCRLARAADHRQDEGHARRPRRRHPGRRRLRRRHGRGAAQGRRRRRAPASRSSRPRSAAPS